jgi:hypothetical protein
MTPRHTTALQVQVAQLAASRLSRDNRAQVMRPAGRSAAGCSVALLLCLLCCSVDTEQSAGRDKSPWYIGH